MTMVIKEININKLLKDYLKKLKMTGLDEKTVKTYGFYLKYFVEFYQRNDLDLNGLTDNEIYKFIQFLKKKGLSPASIKQVLNRVKDFIIASGFNWDIDKRIYRERDKKESANPFFDDELSLILDYTKTHHENYYYLILALYGFGLRISEGVNLKPSDIVKEEGNIFVKVRSDVAKFSKSRIAPLILKDDYRHDFLSFVKKQKDKDYLFEFKQKGKKFRITKDNAKLFFYRLSKKLGLHITAHRFRDSYISYLISKGLKPSIVAKWVGHQDINTTLKYYTKLSSRDELLELAKIF